LDVKAELRKKEKGKRSRVPLCAQATVFALMSFVGQVDATSTAQGKKQPCQLMAENDGSWFQEDGSGRKTTSHVKNVKHPASGVR
jgi:hypothetical protein